MNGTIRAGRVMMSAALVMAAACGDKQETPMSDSAAAMAAAPAAGTAGAPAAPAQMAAPDAEMQPVLDQLGSMGGKPIETLTPAEARKQPTPTDAVKALLAKQGKPATPPPGTTLSNKTVAGLPANVYTPDGVGPFPVIVYYHGGGWVIADKNVYDGGARGLSIAANAIVISADYRQGPENKFPAAHDDAIKVYEWALANAASLKGDPKRVALAGESAGGNLAVATAIAARDRKLQMPLAIVSVYPIAMGDTTSAAYAENANAKPLNRAMMSWFFEHYTKTPADRQDPRINLVAADLKGLPPTTIVNAQIDPLRGDGELLAERMRAAGVTVEQKTYDGVTHEFFGMAAVHPKAKDAQQYAGDALKRAFSR